MILFIIIIFAFVLAIFCIAAITVTYAALAGKIKNERVLNFNKNLTYYIVMSGLLGYALGLSFLLNEALFFISDSWGEYDADGVFTSHKWMIASMIAFALSISLFVYHKKVVNFIHEKFNNVKKRYIKKT